MQPLRFKFLQFVRLHPNDRREKFASVFSGERSLPSVILNLFNRRLSQGLCKGINHRVELSGIINKECMSFRIEAFKSNPVT